MADYNILKDRLEQSQNPVKHPEKWLSEGQMKDSSELVRIANHPTVDIRQRSAALEQLRRNGVENVPQG